MCGRFVVKHAPAQLADLFKLDKVPDILEPRYNVAPSTPVPVVALRDAATRGCANLSWGLLPEWANSEKDRRYPNARAETVHFLPSFRTPFEQKRCLMPMSGFYEWKAVSAKDKRPYFIHMKDDRPFAVAALWDRWTGDTKRIFSCCLITTGPNEVMLPIHDRMPVIVAEADYADWLATDTPAARLKALLRPYPAEEMEAYPVSKYVSKAGNEGPKCVEPLAAGVVS